MKCILAVALLATLQSGCAVKSASAWGATLDLTHRQECVKICAGADMKLTGIVVVMSQSACVCRLQDATSSSSEAAAAATMTAIAVEEERARQAKQAAP